MGMLRKLPAAETDLSALGQEFALIANAPGLFPPREMVPLGPRVTRLEGPPAAIFLDMDGTTTDTEPLFLHDVEEVVRRSTGWRTKADWAGLDPVRDYPNIVGYSTLRNLEYLYEFVGHAIQPSLFFSEVMKGLVFLAEHHVPDDIHFRIETLTDLFGMEAWRHYAADPKRRASDGDALIGECRTRFPHIGQAMFANFGLMIFYADYIDILERVNRGEGASVSQMIYGDPGIPAVGALPGIALLCALVRGWLPESTAPALAEALAPEEAGGAKNLAWLCRRFAAQSIPTALVTSSGSHEANLVLRAVFSSMREEVAGWPVDEATRAAIVAGFASHDAYFDAIVTCDDVIDGRTKPFRDPYTLALGRLGLSGRDAGRVIGFEDTEAGIIAQRGAGIALACATPIEYTMGQDFSAASHVLMGGVREAVFRHGLFMA